MMLNSKVFEVSVDGKEARELQELDNQRVIAVVSGSSHNCALTCDGRLYSWGNNSQGQLGTGGKESHQNPRHIDSLDTKTIVGVACGESHTAVITDRGEAYAWGQGTKGQLGLCTPDNRYTDPDTAEVSWPLRDVGVPRFMKQLRGIRMVQIACGHAHTLLLSDSGELFVAGESRHGALGLGPEVLAPVPVRVTTGNFVGIPVAVVAAGSHHSLVATVGGMVWTWGRGDDGQLGHGDFRSRSVPTQVRKGSVDKVHATAVAGGQGFSLALTHGGEVVVSGSLVGSSAFQLAAIPENVEICHVAAGRSHAIAVGCDGKSFSLTADGPSAPSSPSSPSSPRPALIASPHRPISGRRSLSRQSSLSSTSSSIDSGPLDMDALLSPTRRSPSTSKAQAGSPTRPGRSFRTSSFSSSNVIQLEVNRCVGERIKPGSGRYFVAGSCSDTQSTMLCADVPNSSLLVHRQLPSSTQRIYRGPPGWRNGGGGSPAYIGKEEINLVRSTAAAGGPPAVGLMKEMEALLSSPAIYNGSFRMPGMVRGAHNRCSKTSEALKSGIDVGAMDAGYTALLSLFTASRRGANRPISAMAHPLARAAQRCLARTMNRGSGNEVAFVDSSENPSLERLRYLVVLLHSPLLTAASQHSRSLLLDVANAVAELPNPAKEQLSKWWSSYPPELLGGRLVRMLTKHLASLLKRASSVVGRQLQPQDLQDFSDSDTSDGNPASSLASLLALLKAASEDRCKNGDPPMVPPREFYVEGLVDAVDLAADFICWSESRNKSWLPEQLQEAAKSELGLNMFSFCQHPYLLDPEAKRRLIQVNAALSMGQQIFSSLVGSEMPICILKVRRSHLLEDAMNQLLRNKNPKELRKPLRAEFVGEDGIDQGGVTKELLTLLLRELMMPRRKIFSASQRLRMHWFWQRSFGDNEGQEHSAHEAARSVADSGKAEAENFTLGREEGTRLAGVVMGLSVYNGIQCDVHFPPIVYKHLLRRPVGFHDLARFDPDLHGSLARVLEYNGDVEGHLCLDFVASGAGPGGADVELISGGTGMPVTNQNRDKFVKMYAEYVLHKSVALQVEALRWGFHVCLSDASMQLFNEEELELLLCGTPHLDFYALENKSRYEAGYTKNHPTIRLFWRFLHGSPLATQRKMLSFVTGSDRAPLGGLANLDLLIQRAGPDTDRLPTAQTCFNTLLLPEYSSEGKLKKCLERALEHTEGFGLQ